MDIEVIEKVRVCDICGERVLNDDYGWHTCFICNKDLCDNHRVFVGAYRQAPPLTPYSLPVGEIYYAWMCEEHLGISIAIKRGLGNCFASTLTADTSGDPCDGEFMDRDEIFGVLHRNMVGEIQGIIPRDIM